MRLPQRRLALYALPALVGIGVLMTFLHASALKRQSAAPLQAATIGAMQTQTYTYVQINQGVTFQPNVRYMFECDESSGKLFTEEPTNTGVFVVYDLNDKAFYVGGRSINRPSSLTGFTGGNRYFFWSQRGTFSMRSCARGLQPSQDASCPAITCKAAPGCTYPKPKYDERDCIVSCGTMECGQAAGIDPDDIKYERSVMARDISDSTFIAADVDGDGAKDIVTSRGVVSRNLRNLIPFDKAVEYVIPMDLDNNGKADFIGAFRTMTSGDTVGHGLVWLYGEGEKFTSVPVFAGGRHTVDGLRRLSAIDSQTFGYQAFQNTYVLNLERINGNSMRKTNVVFTEGRGVMRESISNVWSDAVLNTTVDVDGDGVEDTFSSPPFKWTSACDGKEHDLPYTGQTFDAWEHGMPVRRVWYALYDMDADGDTDVVTWENNALVWLQNAGGDVWKTHMIRDADITPGPLLVDDLTGDKRPDILIGAGSQQQPLFLLQNTSEVSGDVFAASSPKPAQCIRK